jgi:uncharacterized membrane protein YgcG
MAGVPWEVAGSAPIVGAVMPILLRTTRHRVAAAISAGAACALAGQASAQVTGPLFTGPDRLGSAVTYRLTTSIDRAGTAPNVAALALYWKLGQKVVVTLSNAEGAQATPYIATRASDGTLRLDNVSADDPEGQGVVGALGVLNRIDGFVSAAPAGAKTWKTTLVVQPPALPTANTPIPQAPPPLSIPVAGARSDDATGTTLAASGSIDRTVTHPAGGGSQRGGGGGGGTGRRGGMGGGGMGGGGGGGMGRGRSGDSSDASSGLENSKVTTKISADAHFGRDGQLTSGTIVETIQADARSQSSPQDQPSTRFWKIERTP